MMKVHSCWILQMSRFSIFIASKQASASKECCKTGVTRHLVFKQWLGSVIKPWNDGWIKCLTSFCHLAKSLQIEVLEEWYWCRCPTAVPSQMVRVDYKGVPQSLKLSLTCWHIQMKCLEKHSARPLYRGGPGGHERKSQCSWYPKDVPADEEDHVYVWMNWAAVATNINRPDDKCARAITDGQLGSRL